MSHIYMPSIEICDRARASRDARFDGLFFIAVRSTGIYCRPVCPAPTAKSRNVVYYPTAAAASAAGYRPCLRCRPELAPGVRVNGNEDAMRRALELIADGVLEHSSIDALAARVQLSSRQLRRLFIANTGATPIAVHATRRLLLAKQLLTETRLPITHVALAAGFKSLRRFNAAFRDSCGIAPSALRKSIAQRLEKQELSSGGVLTLRLAYRPPLEFSEMLQFFAKRAIPDVEHVGLDYYERTIGVSGKGVWIRITSASDKPELKLEIAPTDPRSIPDIVRRVRLMFDLDADLNSAHLVLSRDPFLESCIQQHCGIRIPGTWEGFEAGVRAILGESIHTAGNIPLLQKLVRVYGQRAADHPDAGWIFPSADQLVKASLESSIGLSKSRAVAVRAFATAFINGRIDFDAGQNLESFTNRLCMLPGIGLCTAHYIAMRALNHPDAFALSDSVRSKLNTNGDTSSNGSQWRPWRAYAALHLSRHHELFR